MAQKYLLDTNVCIYFMKNKYNIVDRIRAVGRENCAVSEITAAELYYGASFSSRASEEMKLVDRFLNLIEVVPISSVTKEYGYNKALLRRQGTLIDDFDLLIGSTATVHKYKPYNFILTNSKSKTHNEENSFSFRSAHHERCKCLGKTTI